MLEGDIATERDADRLRALGVPAHQILTGGACHLDARQVGDALAEATLLPADILFIENVGNLICPTSYDLGEDFKVVAAVGHRGRRQAVQVPGDLRPRRGRGDHQVRTCLPHVRFDLDAVREQVASLNPAGTLLVTSASTGEGHRRLVRPPARASGRQAGRGGSAAALIRFAGA